MALITHIQQLKQKHQNLSETVARLQRMPTVDDFQIAAMKKEKLKLKEEISRLGSA